MYAPALVAVMVLVFPLESLADCMEQREFTVTFTTVSCRPLDPESEPVLRDYTGETFGKREEFMERFYKGALVKSKEGQTYVYPSGEKNACDRFPLEKPVTKGISETCCDTGAWGKCILGGSFLYEPDAKPVNAFQ